MKKNLFLVISILMICVGCVPQKKVEVTQTFRVVNQTHDTWLMKEKVVWGGTYVDSASIEVPPMQSDSIQHNFVLNKGGSMHIFYVPLESLNYWYYHKSCKIITRLINLTTQESYEMEETLLPSNYHSGFSEIPPHWWAYDGEEVPIKNNDNHAFKCVINQELFESK